MKNEVVTQNKNKIIKREQKPADVVMRATEAAKELQKIVNNRNKKLILGGKQYLYFEDWQTLGKFDNITAKVTDTEEIREGNKLIGFNACAVAVKNGMEISGAEAECCFDEPNWRNKPRFQLKSMAQTRACAKALRNVLAFIAVLANYEPTPAEEMDGMGNESQNNYHPQQRAREPLATDKQLELISNNMLGSHLMDDKEKQRLSKRLDEGITKKEASDIISWWLGDKKTGKEGERAKREREEAMKQSQDTFGGEVEEVAEEGNADWEFAEEQVSSRG